MSAQGKKQQDYSAAATRRCERVLGTVLRGVGTPWRERIVLVGGLAPMYLIPGSAEEPLVGHVGSTDVDLALGLAVGGADEGAYSTLEKNLKRVGLQRVDGTSWRWGVEVDGHHVVVELLGDDGIAESGTLFTPSVKPPAGTGNLGLLCVRGVELALRDNCVVEREIEMLDGAVSTVQIRAAGLLPFLALKADAYLDRREAKDVYDLLYVLRNWPEGPRAAAADATRSSVREEGFVLSALDRVAADFLSRDHTGPKDYATFMTMGAAGSDGDGYADEALLIWRQFSESFCTDSSKEV